MLLLTSYLAATRDRFLLGLKYADYRTMWIATTCSGAAAWALIVIRGYLAWELTEASLWVGIITFAAMFPRVFSTPFVGYLADKFDRQTLLRWIFGLNLAHNILLGFLVMNGLAGPWVLTFLALFNGTLRAGQMTVSQALIPNLRRRRRRRYPASSNWLSPMSPERRSTSCRVISIFLPTRSKSTWKLSKARLTCCSI